MLKLPLERFLRNLGLRSDAAQEEIAEELTSMLPQADATGIAVTPSIPRQGETVTIAYSGMLHQNGADSLYLHYGYGPGPWQDVTDVPMNATADGWRAQIPAERVGQLAFCFHDGAGHWDNNGGQDWHLTIR